MATTLLDGSLIRSGSVPTSVLVIGSGVVSSSAQASGWTVATASVSLFVLQNNFTGSFTGSFVGEGSNLIFTTVNTNKETDSVLIIGNIYNNYSNKQTTVFKNGDVVVSGSVTLSEEGVLVLTPRNTPLTNVSGTLFYSSSGELYLST